MNISQRIQILYGQVAVFSLALSGSFNDWSDVHYAQGFSWRPGSVSFRTLSYEGFLDARVVVSSAPFVASREAVRIIAVPFEVSEPGGIEVAGVAGGFRLPMAVGAYDLVFEHGPSSPLEMWARFFFRAVKTSSPPRIIRADPDLQPPRTLCMSAQPA